MSTETAVRYHIKWGLQHIHVAPGQVEEWHMAGKTHKGDHHVSLAPAAEHKGYEALTEEQKLAYVAALGGEMTPEQKAFYVKKAVAVVATEPARITVMVPSGKNEGVYAALSV